VGKQESNGEMGHRRIAVIKWPTAGRACAGTSVAWHGTESGRLGPRRKRARVEKSAQPLRVVEWRPLESQTTRAAEGRRPPPQRGVPDPQKKHQSSPSTEKAVPQPCKSPHTHSVAYALTHTKNGAGHRA